MAFAETLYGNIEFLQSFYDALGPSGVLVMQLGQSPNVRDPDETYSKHKNRAAVLRLLESVGFRSIHTYEEVSILRMQGIATPQTFHPTLINSYPCFLAVFRVTVDSVMLGPS